MLRCIQRGSLWTDPDGAGTPVRYVVPVPAMQYARDPRLDNKGSLMQASVCLCGAREGERECAKEKER